MSQRDAHELQRAGEFDAAGPHLVVLAGYCRCDLEGPLARSRPETSSFRLELTAFDVYQSTRPIPGTANLPRGGDADSGDCIRPLGPQTTFLVLFLKLVPSNT